MIILDPSNWKSVTAYWRGLNDIHNIREGEYFRTFKEKLTTCKGPESTVEKLALNNEEINVVHTGIIARRGKRD